MCKLLWRSLDHWEDDENAWWMVDLMQTEESGGGCLPQARADSA